MVDPAKKPEAKAIAAPVGGGLGGALVPFVIWLLGVYVWDAPSDAAHAIAAASAVPPPVTGLIIVALPAVLALVAAYLAPHTHRPDLAAEVQDQTTHLDERIATHLEQVDATLTEMRDDMQHTAPIERIPITQPEVGLRIMDEAHD